MPGGRLTQQDRQQIAAGLADGLAYAEIARRLDRPTSTITREVMRNGGPAGYRADLAQHATQQRTNRRRTASAQGPAASPQPHGRDPEAVLAFQEKLTTVFIMSGLPKMMARVLACLYCTDSGSLTAGELARLLQVSPASVSKATTFLSEMDLINRDRDQGRRERYFVDDDLWYRSMVRSAKANDDTVAAAREGVGVLGRGTPAGDRLESVARFLDFVTESLLRAAEQSREILYSKPTPTPEDD
ncbi:GbsR/MarR family transcriptional regulator [Actinomadura rupiterrae]|uniref:GbsR/MarR family transcriptional regulator n=1 Tax=Actinomadura rupiterrae TaxID=559627 RepID=UPI0020A4E17F|nr:helix-turn-helix domain-containing protein [Actinomadura rupiterrae]MCP2340749.1 DNA-binding transcriptional regulator GbsR (MarR family) [Actinomadura rupiterrae]